MVIFNFSKNKASFVILIIFFKILFICTKESVSNKNAIIFNIKNAIINESLFESERKEKNFYNLIINKLVPNNLYLDFQINSENVNIPGYLTFTTHYNYYGIDTCLKLENDNIFNISSKIENMANYQLYSNQYQKFYYLKENISIFDINNNFINLNNIRIIMPQNNENQAKCLIVGLNPILDLTQNKEIENLPLAIKSNRNNNFKTYLTIIYQKNKVLMTLGEPLHILYPDLYNIKNYKEIDNYNLKKEYNTYFLKNQNIWSIKLDKIYIGNDTYNTGERFIGQFSLDYIPFMVPMELFRKYISYGLDYYISKNICGQKGRPLTNKFAHSIINDKKQTFVFIYCEKSKIENLTEFYNKIPDISFKNKELNKTFRFKNKDLFFEEDNFLVLMIMPDLFSKYMITLGMIFMKKYLFCFNYDRNRIGFYNESIKNLDNIKKYISENKIPIELFYALISFLFLVIIIFMFHFFGRKKIKDNIINENRDNEEDLIEKELIDINKENESL